MSEEVKAAVTEEAAVVETPAVAETTEGVEMGHKEGAAEKANEKEEELTFFKGIDEFYPKGHIEKPIEDSKISRRTISFFDVQGQYSYKRYNVNFLEDDVIIFITGNKF